MKRLQTIVAVALLVLGCARRAEVRPEKKQVRRQAQPSVEEGVGLHYADILKLKALNREDVAFLLVDRLAEIVASRMRPRFYNSAQGISDLESSSRKAYVQRAVELGLMDVFPDGSFQPEDLVQRCHLAIIVQNVLRSFGQASLAGRKESPYRDVPATFYASGAILLAVEREVLLPRSPEVFAPFEPVTGQEAVKALDRLRSLLK